MTHGLYTSHSDVTQQWPELFAGLDPEVTNIVAETAANSILEGYEVTRSEVAQLIIETQESLARVARRTA